MLFWVFVWVCLLFFLFVCLWLVTLAIQLLMFGLRRLRLVVEWLCLGLLFVWCVDWVGCLFWWCTGLDIWFLHCCLLYCCLGFWFLVLRYVAQLDCLEGLCFDLDGGGVAFCWLYICLLICYWLIVLWYSFNSLCWFVLWIGFVLFGFLMLFCCLFV